MNNHAIAICNTSIRQDPEGRYCLNDLHKISGGEDRHKPAFWTRGDSFRDLIDAIQQDRINQGADLHHAPVHTAHGGTNPGTYVCKQLVYAYAMWISAKFHLQVINVFDQYVTNPDYGQASAAIKAPSNLREALLLALDQEEKIAAQALQIAVTAPKALVYDAVVADKYMSLADFAKRLPGVNIMCISRDLARLGYLFRQGKG